MEITVETNTHQLDEVVKHDVRELAELDLALVGGGMGDVAF
jgi:hypothetical protein